MLRGGEQGTPKNPKRPCTYQWWVVKNMAPCSIPVPACAFQSGYPTMPTPPQPLLRDPNQVDSMKFCPATPRLQRWEMGVSKWRAPVAGVRGNKSKPTSCGDPYFKAHRMTLECVSLFPMAFSAPVKTCYFAGHKFPSSLWSTAGHPEDPSATYFPVQGHFSGPNELLQFTWILRALGGLFSALQGSNMEPRFRYT